MWNPPPPPPPIQTLEIVFLYVNFATTFILCRNSFGNALERFLVVRNVIVLVHDSDCE